MPTQMTRDIDDARAFAGLRRTAEASTLVALRVEWGANSHILEELFRAEGVPGPGTTAVVPLAIGLRLQEWARVKANCSIIIDDWQTSDGPPV
jgi:hypothetical protein